MATFLQVEVFNQRRAWFNLESIAAISESPDTLYVFINGQNDAFHVTDEDSRKSLLAWLDDNTAKNDSK